MKRLAVYCASTLGQNEQFLSTCNDLADGLVQNGVELVYGGSTTGLMGVLADAVLARGGTVIGVMPQHLEHKESSHPRLTALHIVENMHQRKALMEELSNGFIALPGGLGTLDELAEIMAWKQLQIHTKPCALFNIDGYYNSLLHFLKTMAIQQFVAQETLNELVIMNNKNDLKSFLNQYF